VVHHKRVKKEHHPYIINNLVYAWQVEQARMRLNKWEDKKKPLLAED
jgi:hypothetical protein